MTNKAKVIFVRPPNLQKSGQWKKQGVIRCPLNIALLASFIRTKGSFDCSIVDFEVTPASSVDQMAETILQSRPKYVCFTTLTPRFPIVIKIAQEIKRRQPDIFIIIGGPHVTGAPLTSIMDGISYGIIGEGEEALLELLEKIENGQDPSGVKNIVYKDGLSVKVNPVRPFINNLDALPFAAWDLMDINEYNDPTYFNGSHLAIYSGRGCPYDCIFCASAVTWKRKLRLRSVENVIQEISDIVRLLKVKNLMFWDDTFAIDEQRAFSICNRIIEEQFNISYTVQIRADSVTKRLADILKKSGCCFAAIGVESGNEEMLVRIGKKETKEQFRNAVRIMKEAGLPIIASYIIGLPGDTHETIRETIDFAFELNADQSKFMILAPYPGTHVYDLACQIGLVDILSFEQMEASNYYDSVGINLSKVSDSDLLRYQDEAYKRFDKFKKEGV